MRESLTDYCARTQRQTLLDQWDQVGQRPADPGGPLLRQPPEGLVDL